MTFKKPIRLSAFICLSFGTVLVGCGSPKDEEISDPLPQSNNPNVPQYVVPAASNGYYLSAISIKSANDTVLQEVVFDIDVDSKTISEFDITIAGEQRLAVSYQYDDLGLISKQTRYTPSGRVDEVFETTFDSRSRMVTETSSRDGDAYISVHYLFNDVGAPFEKVLTLNADDSEFSRTAFQYDESRKLVSSILTSPLVPTVVRRLYDFSVDGQRLQAVTDNSGQRLVMEYDQNGNVSSRSSYNELGELTGSNTFTYEFVDALVPNIPLYRNTYEYDQLF